MATWQSYLLSDLPKLTVISIGRNSLSDLERTVASVRSQNYANLHHVLIDGASTDGSAQRVLDLAADGQTTAVSRPDDGIYDAMNSALEFVADGHLLFLHAGDTFVDSQATSRAMEAIASESHPPDLAIGWSRFVIGEQQLPYIVGGQTPNALTSAHESTFFSAAFHRNERYNTNLQLAADYEFFRALDQRSDLVVLRLPFTISKFAFGGRSNNPAFDRSRFSERARINEAFGEKYGVLARIKTLLRMVTRRVFYAALGADRAAVVFLRLACRRGNSGARRLPVDQVLVD